MATAVSNARMVIISRVLPATDAVLIVSHAQDIPRVQNVRKANTGQLAKVAAVPDVQLV